MDATLRPARVSDAPRLGAIVAGGFEAYRAFAPADWEPPPPENAEAELRRRLALDSTWCLLAEAGGGPVAYVAFQPATLATVPSDEPGLAHLWHLFVDRAHWGTGLARELLGAALDEARARGFRGMRLATPADHVRARRFYEREGFRVAGEPFMPDDGFGLALIEYRRPL